MNKVIGMRDTKSKRVRQGIFLVIAFCSNITMAWAEDFCITSPEGSNAASNLVTTYGSSNFSCPSGFQTATVDVSTMISGESRLTTIDVLNYQYLDGRPPETITVNIVTTLNADESVTFDAPVFGLDVAFTNSAKKGNGCLYSYGTDTTADTVGFSSSGTIFPTKDITYCVDTSQDVLAEPARQRDELNITVDAPSCNDLHGVDINCGFVPFGERRTVIVAKDTFYNDLANEYQKVPGYGFSDENGAMDLSNSVCVCYGPDNNGIPYEPLANEGPGFKSFDECNPNPEGTTSADHKDVIGLESCEIAAGSDIPLNINLTNPYCFQMGGTWRCF